MKLMNTIIRCSGSLGLAFALLLGGGVAHAQEDGGTDAAAASGAQVEEASGPSDFARVADEDETIYSVQRKAYLIKDKIELSLMFSALFNDRFVQSYAPVGSVAYHLSESFALEAFGGYFFPGESGAIDELFQTINLRPPFSQLTQLLWAAGLGVMWSPIYGKLEIAGKQLGNFNFYLNTGIAVGETRVECTPAGALDPNQFDGNCPSGEEPQYEPNTFRPMAVFGGGLRFLFNDRYGLRFEVRDYLFVSRVFRPDEGEPLLRFSDSVRNNVYANIGFSILLGGTRN